jgi:hypothetical protein
MQLWTLLHNSSHSIKEPNQTNIIRTNIQVHRYLYKKNSFVFVPKNRSPIPKVTLGTGFRSVKSTFVFRKRKGKSNQSKAEIDEKRLR